MGHSLYQSWHTLLLKAVDKSVTTGIRAYTAAKGREDLKLQKERGRPGKAKVWAVHVSTACGNTSGICGCN